MKLEIKLFDTVKLAFCICYERH